MLNRRSFLRGAGALLAAPAIVRVASIMPIRQIEMPARSGLLMAAANPSPLTWQDALFRMGLDILRGDPQQFYEFGVTPA